MSDNQQRRAFEEPHAGSGGVTGAAVAALAHGGVPAAGDESVNESAIAAAPAGVGPARAAHLPAGADPDAVRDWFELETIVNLPAPALSFAKTKAAAADYRRARPRRKHKARPTVPVSRPSPNGALASLQQRRVCR